MAATGRGGGAGHYVRLGLAPGASPAEVKKAYRSMTMQLHPDHAGPGSLQTFLAVKAAYEWIVAHPSLPGPGDGRPRSVFRRAARRPVRRAPVATARPPTPPAAARSSWPGGHWYRDGMLARAAARAGSIG